MACGYGIHERIQEATLRKMYLCCQGMKVGKSRNLLPFQKGFMTSIRSLFGLFSDLKKINVKYILTSRLNQDCLENLFSRIRGLGHFYDHPLPIDVKYRMRLLLLGSNANKISLSNSTSVASDDDGEDSFMISHLISNISPDMSEAMKMIDGEIELRDIMLDDATPTSVPVPLSSTGVDCSVEGFRFLAGYIAYRGRKYSTSLGTPSGQLLSLPSNTPSDGWIEQLSRGGLLVPSDDWLNKISQFELIFIEEHGKDSLSKKKNVIQAVCDKIALKFPEVPIEIIKIYVRTRTFIRLRHLNAKNKKMKTEGQQRKARQWVASSK